MADVARVLTLSLEDKVRLLTGADMWSLHALPAAGLRRIVVSDGPAGVRGERWDERDVSANVPSATALAATWDVALVERIGGLLAGECRRKGVDVLLAPTVNLHRTPFAGRHFECFSEDPLLTARIGGAYVRGLQSGGVGATVKHFVANDSETERNTVDVRVGERALRELYLAPFEAIVREERPWAVMSSYNRVDGVTMSASPLLAEVLKEEWGFEGLVMSDWWAAWETDAPARAGIDLLMPGPGGPWGSALVDAVRAGRVPESAVDAKVERVLGLGARAESVPALPDPPAPDAPAVAATLREAAAASFVLARNAGSLLPLSGGSLHRVAVLGPNAAVARTLGGGSATVFPPYTVAPLDGLRAALGDGVEVVHEGGVRAATRNSVAAPELLRLPGDGSGPGAEVRFLDADGAELGRERRLGGGFAWHVHFGDGIEAARVASVEVRTRVVAAASGEHLIGCSGLGRFTLALGSGAPAEVELTLPPDADVAAAHMRPPQHAVPVELAAGEGVDVVLTHAVDGFPFGTPGDVFRLDVEPPVAPDDERLDRAVSLAASADVAIVVVGTTDEVESESFDRPSLGLPGRQDELIRRVAAANPRTVVVVNSGAPVLMPWVDDVPAVLLTWFGGQEYGNALADVLLGRVEPGGRLPTLWPSSEAGLPSPTPADGTLVYEEGLFVGHRNAALLSASLFPFGHGEGYTSWEYVSFDAPAAAGGAASVVVRNTGARAGREVVQVYASWPGSAVERPERWLVGFAGVEAAPGESVAVEVEVPRRGLEHWDEAAHAWALEPGEVTLSAGRSSADLRLSAALRIA